MGYKDRLPKAPVFTIDIDSYFKGLGFELGVMDPSEWNTEYEEQLKRDAKCLTTRFTDKNGVGERSVTIFMNRREAYMEVEDDLGGYLFSYYHRFKEDSISLEEIENVLDELTDKLG